MTRHIKIDFVSDVVCPWCVIGLRGLETALEALKGDIEAEIHLQPFELNFAMPPEGQNHGEHIAEKYGRTPEQVEEGRRAIRERAAAVGFDMRTSAESRVYNSFDAHRLLHWAELEGRHLELKHALFSAYFTEGLNISDHAVLLAKVESVGLDVAAARDVLSCNRYADEVRAAEKAWAIAGINSVPSIIINEKYLISGGQPATAFEQHLRRIAAEG
ncbi:MAG TPA: DsbA family oxidoreductase [Stellaceae bacterium]|jgi:predicted DsbA family dithiol-disulfide isomerase|nr:DsbA family oxidoreductase [Stellaceae bacterium]